MIEKYECPICNIDQNIIKEIHREREGTNEVHLGCGHRTVIPLQISRGTD